MQNQLWYQKEATCFEEALPIGNGSFGAMVYGGVKKEKFSLNLDTLWSGKPQIFQSENAPAIYRKAQKLTLEGRIAEAEALMTEQFHNLWSAYYLPMANLYIESNRSDGPHYLRQLDLTTALSSTRFGHTLREAFLSFPHRCLAIRETGGEKANYLIRLDSQLQYQVRITGDTLILSGRCPSEGGSRWADSGYTPFIYQEDAGITFTLALKILTDGTLSALDDTLSIQNASELVILAAAESSYTGHGLPYDETHEAKCLETLAQAAADGYDVIKARHIADYAALYNRVTLDLQAEDVDRPTDERLQSEAKDKGLVELLFNYGRYLTIASSRPGSQAATLQGIWNEHLAAPWRSNYTVNINTEMNYWPTLMCGLTECTEPLLDLIRKIADTGRATAQNYYGAEGFTSHHNVDLWGHSSPVGGRDNPSSNSYAGWCLSSGWLCAHLFRQYEYTLDEEFLRRTAYPIMKEAARFYLSVMTEDEGELILCPASSPENWYYGADGKPHALAKKTTMSQAIIFELFTNCVKSCEILGIDADFAARLRESLKKIHPHTIGPDGRLLEWDKDYEEVEVHHRHVSHLYGLFPGEQITRETSPELIDACKKSLEVRGDAGTGWSLGWKVNLWARLKDGDRTLKLIYDQLFPVSAAPTDGPKRGGTYPNLMDAHPPFQIDGNFGVTSGIAQMFVQHENGKILILPALPDGLADGRIEGIRTKGCVCVSVTWKNHKAETIALLSPLTQTVKVEYEGTVWDVPLTANETYTIVPTR